MIKENTKPRFCAKLYSASPGSAHLRVSYLVRDLGRYSPTLETPEQAFRHAIIVGMITLVYIGLQAFAVVSAPLARETRYLLDLLVSLVPLALVGYAVAQSFSGYLPLGDYQKAVLWLAGTACMIDVIIFVCRFGGNSPRSDRPSGWFSRDLGRCTE